MTESAVALCATCGQPSPYFLHGYHTNPDARYHKFEPTQGEQSVSDAREQLLNCIRGNCPHAIPEHCLRTFDRVIAAVRGERDAPSETMEEAWDRLYPPRLLRGGDAIQLRAALSEGFEAGWEARDKLGATK